MKTKTVALPSIFEIGPLLTKEIEPIISYYLNGIRNGFSGYQKILNDLQKMLYSLRRCDNLKFRDYLEYVDFFDNKQEISLLSIKRGLSEVEFRQLINDFSKEVVFDVDSWMKDFCVSQNITTVDGSIYVSFALRSDLSQSDIIKANNAIPGLFDFLLSKIGNNVENYLYWNNEQASKINIETDVFKALALMEPTKQAFGEIAVFPWNHSHPTRVIEVQTEYARRTGYFFSTVDRSIIKTDVPRDAEVFSIYGISFIDRDYTYQDFNGNKKKLMVNSAYKNYVHRLLVFRNVYSYISIHSRLSESNKVEISLLIRDFWTKKIPKEDVAKRLEEIGLEQELLERFKDVVFEGPEDCKTFFGIQSFYPEVDALENGGLAYFISRNMVNRMLERTDLGQMSYHEAIEFIKLKSTKVLRMMLCEKYDLSDLFIRDRKFFGNRIVSVSAKEKYRSLFFDLWNAKNLTEAREARDKILATFVELYQTGELYGE